MKAPPTDDDSVAAALDAEREDVSTLGSRGEEEGPTVTLFELFHYLHAHKITAYREPASLTPGAEVEGPLVAAIVDDMAEAFQRDVIAEIRAWCDANPALPAEITAARPSLCGAGCCFECAACAAQPGSPVLCADCLRRRLECQARRAASAAPVEVRGGAELPPLPEPPAPRLDAARLRVGADLRRIGIGIFELSGAVRHNTIWLLRHGIAAAERRMENGGAAAAEGVTRAVDRYLVDPFVVRIMRLAARVDGGLEPENATREAVLSMVYGTDRRLWPTWIKLEELG